MWLGGREGGNVVYIPCSVVRKGFPGGASGKEPACLCRRCKRHGFNPWVRKIPWRRAWQPTLVFLPGESHGQRSLVGYSPQGRTESDTTEATWHTRPVWWGNVLLRPQNQADPSGQDRSAAERSNFCAQAGLPLLRLQIFVNCRQVLNEA